MFGIGRLYRQVKIMTRQYYRGVTKVLYTEMVTAGAPLELYNLALSLVV